MDDVTRSDDFDWLLEQEIPHLRRYAYALTDQPVEADDLVQDCLERALRKQRLWKRSGRLRSWLFRMLYRIYLNRHRGRRARARHVTLEHLDAEAAGLASQPRHIECRDTIEALAQLPEEQRVAILLIALEDLSYEEAAWVLGIPIGTLRSRVSRGRSRLRQLCAHSEDEPATESGTSAVILRRVK